MNDRPRKSSSSGSRDAVSREERKARTRQEIIDAALRLLADRSFDAVSLREVTREVGIVPGAFYRHFGSMDALGLVLVDESFRLLREMLRDARAGALDPDRIIESSVEVLAASVTQQPLHWRFIGRERSAGPGAMRYAIRTEIRLITSELATDLARFPGLNKWSTEDLNVFAGLLVNAMTTIAEALLETEDPAARADITRMAAKQLRMIVVGAVGWRSAP